MERKSLCLFLNLLIEYGKGEENYYLFDITSRLLVKKMSAKMMLEKLGYYTWLSQPVSGFCGKNIYIDCEVVINDTKR